MQNHFEKLVSGHQAVFEKTFDEKQIDQLDLISKMMLKTFKAGKKVMLCGNGGSAADAQHIAAEFVGRFECDRKPLPALALTTDTSALTAIGNDYDFEEVFSRQVNGLGNEGDLLIAISTSGNSANIIKAIHAAKSKDIKVVGFSGRTGGVMKDLCDETMIVKSEKTSHIQECHIFALHSVAEVVEKVLFT